MQLKPVRKKIRGMGSDHERRRAFLQNMIRLQLIFRDGKKT